MVLGTNFFFHTKCLELSKQLLAKDYRHKRKVHIDQEKVLKSFTTKTLRKARKQNQHKFGRRRENLGQIFSSIWLLPCFLRRVKKSHENKFKNSPICDDLLLNNKLEIHVQLEKLLPGTTSGEENCGVVHFLVCNFCVIQPHFLSDAARP